MQPEVTIAVRDIATSYHHINLALLSRSLRLSCFGARETDNVLLRSEVTCFIELPVGRQVGFWHGAEDPSAVDYDSAV
jgi:hypothetical protein